jgi:hypothetical protein
MKICPVEIPGITKELEFVDGVKVEEGSTVLPAIGPFKYVLLPVESTTYKNPEESI